MTLEESIIWDRLRGKQLGHRFRRQHIIGDYIVDFVCLSSLLVVEIDGKYHQEEETQQKDEVRTDFLNSLGYKVIRFTNEEVVADIDHVINQIKSEL